MSAHAEEAERMADRGLDDDNLDEEHRGRLIAYAHVRATLAVAEQLEAIHTLLNNSGAMA